MRAIGRCLLALAWLSTAPAASSQQPVAHSASASLRELVNGLGTTTRVLMIGAHPDDEDTQLITWLARARHVETAYLSLTRGDGGQNLIGNQLGQVLGMIRTEELLAARRIDGGRQYFTRAYDFGFSKSLDETQQRWPRDSILQDMVAIVRAFRPHVIIAVWTGTATDGHGHHQYAGVVARDVFDAAADSIRFPARRVAGLSPWTVSKFYRLRRGGAGATLSFNAGEYDPALGQSYSELATASRSQHRSQGQGTLPVRGPRYSGVRLEASRVSDTTVAERGLFDGIDTSWARFKTAPLLPVARMVADSLVLAEAAVVRSLDLANPSRAVAPLAAYIDLVNRGLRGTCAAGPTSLPACDPRLADFGLALAQTRDRATAAVLAAAGIVVEATASRELVALGDTVPVTVTVYNQGPTTVGFQRSMLLGQPHDDAPRPRIIPPDSSARQTLMYRANSLSMPWWLRDPQSGAMFKQPLAQAVVSEERMLRTAVETELTVNGVPVTVRTGPVVYRYADAVLGEVRRPMATIPEISVLLQHEIEYARANAPLERTMLVYVHSAATSARDVQVTLHLPRGLKTDTAMRRITLKPYGSVNLYFRITGRMSPGRDSIVATATTHGETFDVGFVPFEYEHIRPLRWYRRSSVTVEAVNATFANLKVGYIRGVGDNVMPMLEQLGLSVAELDPATLPQIKLGGFTTIVLGPRAYEANPAAMAAATPILMKFARDGGTVVAQYGQQEMAVPGVLPFPITFAGRADRVTDETATVRVLDPGSPLLVRPNKIAESDFAGWVQERSLYMPRTFDAKYRTLFSMNDPGEPPNDGGVLVAPVGKGVYVYTNMSFFRQLPAGHPGAARLFINLLSADARAAARPAIPRSGTTRP